MAGQVLVISGSARPKGYTAEIVENMRFRLILGPDQVIDLLSCGLEPFRYDSKPSADSFASIVDRIAHHRHVIFVTPVYWYAMSGLMKTFFDRLTDLLLIPEYKALGRSLAGRDVWLIANGTDEALPDGFCEPFARTAHYFGMHWRREFYVQIDTMASPSEQKLAGIEDLAAVLSISSDG